MLFRSLALLAFSASGLSAAVTVVVPLERSATVPYLNVTVVAALFALTVPLSVAALTVTPLAAPVVTVGA